MLEEIQRLAAAGEGVKAADMAVKAALESDAPDAWMLAASLCEMAGMKPEALRCGRRLALGGGGDAHALHAAAGAACLNKAWDLAAQWSQKALDLGPAEGLGESLSFMCAAACARSGQKERALGLLEAVRDDYVAYWGEPLSKRSLAAELGRG